MSNFLFWHLFRNLQSPINKTVRDHGHPQHNHWTTKQSYANYIKQKNRKPKGTTKTKWEPQVSKPPKAMIQHVDIMNTTETQYSSMCGLKQGAQWMVWVMELLIKGARMLCSGWGEKYRDKERNSERERELMVCMIISVTAESNQQSWWAWQGWLW